MLCQSVFSLALGNLSCAMIPTSLGLGNLLIIVAFRTSLAGFPLKNIKTCTCRSRSRSGSSSGSAGNRNANSFLSDSGASFPTSLMPPPQNAILNGRVLFSSSAVLLVI